MGVRVRVRVKGLGFEDLRVKELRVKGLRVKSLIRV